MFRSPDPAFDGKDVRLIDSLHTGCSDARKTFAKKPRLLGKILATIGSTYDGLNIPEEAVPVLTEAVELLSQTSGAGHQETLSAKTELGNALWQASRVPEAIEILRSVQSSWVKMHATDVKEYYEVLVTLASVLDEGCQYEEALQWQSKAVDGLLALLGPNDPATLSAQQGLGWLHFQTGGFEQARSILERTVKQLELATGAQSEIAVVNASAYLIGYAHMVSGTIELQLGNRHVGDALIKQGVTEMEADMPSIMKKRPWLTEDAVRLERLADSVERWNGGLSAMTEPTTREPVGYLPAGQNFS